MEGVAEAATAREVVGANERSQPASEDVDVINIFFFWPNVIGYIRIFLAIIALLVAMERPWMMVMCYTISQFLDIADGYVARALNQSTVFGAVLDQVTDRLSTVQTLMLNAAVYPRFFWLFSLVLLVDLGGHWVHTIASATAGARSHKAIPTTWPLLKLYYESRRLMFVCHASNEFVWGALFMLSRRVRPVTRTLICILLCPTAFFCALKTVTNFLQMCYGAQTLARIDAAQRRKAAE